MLTLVLVVAVLTCTNSVGGQSNCVTPTGVPGKCVSIYDCVPLLEQAHHGGKEEKSSIEKFLCGYSGNIPRVCCPATNVQLPENNCYTPENNPGRCVNVNSCKYLYDLLVPPVSQETLAYFDQTKCKGKGRYSVCCGPTDPGFIIMPTEDCKATVSALPPDPLSGCCGVDSREGVKIDYTAPTLSQYPWLALVEYEKGEPSKSKEFFTPCAGSLISGKYVMTAAHCLVGAVSNIGTPKNVILGEHDKTSKGRDCARVGIDGEICTDGELRIAIARVIAHPEYDPANDLKRHDIGLVELQELAPYTDFIRPICLPATDLTEVLPPNFVLHEAGWGLQYKSQPKEIKAHIDLPYIPLSECQEAYTSPGRKVQLWEGHLCAGSKRGSYSCRGGGGSPLMYSNGIAQEAIGVVSFGPYPCTGTIPNVYTKVFPYVDWIRKTIET